MSVEGLHRDLLAIPGVADATVEGAATSPTSVRVRLDAVADPEEVGTAVRRVLEARGMSSRVAPAPRGAAARPPILVVASDPTDLREEPGDDVEHRPAAIGAAPRPDAIAGLASLSVEESVNDVLVVAVSTAGHRFSRRTTEIDAAGVAAAVVAVLGAMLEGRPVRLLAVTSSGADGTEVVTVALERRDGRRVAGAATVTSGRPYAVARATWMALRD